MLRGHDIVCFANDWASDPLSKKHIMERLARSNRVLWIDSLGCRSPHASGRDLSRMMGKLGASLRGCRQVAPRIWVLSPVAIPFHGNPAARAFNERWLRAVVRRAMRGLGMSAPLTWSFIPSSAGVAGFLGERLLVYHCVDEFSRFTGVDAATIEEMEGRLARRADLVLVSAERLLASKRRHNPETHLVTHGVDLDHFRRALDPATEIPADLPRGDGPVVGFFGLIADWVDLDLVRHLCLARPGYRVVLIGKSDTDVAAVRDLPNLTLIPRRDYADLPRYCRGFDVGILPFRLSELTLSANPLKLREYVAAGLPVVATDIPEARRLAPHVHVARSAEEFVREVDALLESGAAGPRYEISRSMESESWDRKVAEMEALVEERLARPAAKGAA